MSRIFEIHSIKEIEDYPRSNDTLWIFDIDETLLIPQDPAFQKPNLIDHPYIQLMKNQLSLRDLDFLSNFVLMACPSQLIEQETPKWLKQLDNTPIIALTAAMTHRFDGDFFLPELRYQELLKHDLDFSSHFQDIFEIETINFCNGSRPVFYRGVLCSNGDFKRQNEASSKGRVLCAFLKKIGWIPSEIVFVDDKLYNIKEVEETLALNYPSISYTGLHFLGAKSYAVSKISEQMMREKWQPLMEKL